MSVIARTFEGLAKEKSGAFIPYLCTGDMDVNFTISLAGALFDGGADILELGLPFSDPIADGPVIQKAMQRSLSNGFKVRQIFETIESLRESGREQPIVVMSYYNLILRYGVCEFCAMLAKSGGDAVLVVDLPPEESGQLQEPAKNNGLDIIRLVTPTTSDGRLQQLLSEASGFVYAVSVAGTTGARGELPKSALDLLKRASSMTELPVALGFGISTPEQVKQAMSSGAAGVVEGSRIAEIYSEHLGDVDTAKREVLAHAKQMKAATRF